LLVTACVVFSSLILAILIKEELSSTETSVLTRATLRDIPEDTILNSLRYTQYYRTLIYSNFAVASIELGDLGEHFETWRHMAGNYYQKSCQQSSIDRADQSKRRNVPVTRAEKVKAFKRVGEPNGRAPVSRVQAMPLLLQTR
jgi:hypothetical protein